MPQKRALLRELYFYRGFFFLLLAGSAVYLISAKIQLIQEGQPFGTGTVIESRAPFAREIKKIIAPLKYTGLYDFMNPDMYISIDPEKQTWTLQNIHNFDKNGQLILQKNRYGLCGDLAAFAFQKVRPLLDPKRYDVRFLLVSESSYFNTEGGTHIVLDILDRKAYPEPKRYILDPSFRKYGSTDLFGAYRPIEKFEEMTFVKSRLRGQSFQAGSGPPIHINSRIMLSLYLMPVDGHLDGDNFSLVLSATKRYEYQNNYLFTRLVRNGSAEDFEMNASLRKYLRPGLYEELRDRLIHLSNKMRIEPDPYWTFSFPANFSAAASQAIGGTGQPNPPKPAPVPDRQ